MSTSTLDDEYDDFDELDDEDDEQGFSGLLVLAMGALMFGAMVLVVWIAYSHGVKMGEARNDPPFIAADPEPVKIENSDLADAGLADDGGREVFDQYDGSATSDVAIIDEAREEPMPREAADNPLTAVAAASEDAGVDDAISDRILALAAEEAAAVEDEIKYVAAAGPSEGETPEQAAAAEAAAATQSAVRPATPATNASASRAVSALSGTHLVQIAALGSRAEADAAWARIEQKLGAYLNGKAPNVIAPLNASDVYYRLRVGPFASRDAASDYCKGLKERGQGCLVKAK
ncbi:MAG: SPOR domain-containing protein [Pseudomonadota bacterium]